MKNKKPNAEHLWKQFEDLLVPRLRLSVIERAVYSHLLRHSRLEGKLRLRFSISWLARGARLSVTPTRQAVRRLVDHGALRLVERSKAGHEVEVRLPEEIRVARAPAHLPVVASLEDTDFLRTNSLRQAIHSRERGHLCAGSRPSCGPLITSCPKLSWGAIPTATSSPAVWNVTRKKGRLPPPISYAGSIARDA